MGTIVSSDPISAPLLFDGDLLNGFNKSAASCYFGIELTSGYVGILSEVKFFMNPFLMATYAGNLLF